MKRSFWVSIILGLTAFLVMPIDGLSAPLSKRIDQTRSKIRSKEHKEHVLSDTIAVSYTHLTLPTTERV